MASNKLLELLTMGIARELQVSVQYMWQHVLARGVEGAVAENIFRETAIAEMKHAEELAERLSCLNGIPTVNPNSISVGTSLVEMLKLNVQAEEEAISLYKHTIKIASDEGDFTTMRLLEDILSHEEKHLDKFAKLLVGMTSPFTQP